MAFAGVLNDAEVKAALDGCAGELHLLTALHCTASFSNQIHHNLLYL